MLFFLAFPVTWLQYIQLYGNAKIWRPYELKVFINSKCYGKILQNSKGFGNG